MQPSGAIKVSPELSLVEVARIVMLLMLARALLLPIRACKVEPAVSSRFIKFFVL